MYAWEVQWGDCFRSMCIDATATSLFVCLAVLLTLSAVVWSSLVGIAALLTVRKSIENAGGTGAPQLVEDPAYGAVGDSRRRRTRPARRTTSAGGWVRHRIGEKENVR